MSCFFIVDAYIDKHRGYGMYNNYIKNVKPIVESFGGEYLARTENVTSLNPSRNPQRVIIIKNSIFRNSLIFQGLPPIKYQNLMYFPLFLPL